MDRKFIGIALILAGLSLMGLIIYFVFFYDYGYKTALTSDIPQEIATTTDNLEPIKINNTPTINNQGSVENVDPLVAIKNSASLQQKIAPSTEELEKISIANIGTSFTQRYGSFSNQTDFGNISDLEMFMSAKMKAWAQKEVSTLRLQKRGGEVYYGITTKVIGYNFSTFDSNTGKVEMVLQTRRRETNDKTVNSYNQNMIIKFVKEDGSWVVDAADWKEGKE